MRITGILIILFFIISIILIGISFFSKHTQEVAKVTIEITRGKPYNSLNESQLDELIGNISLTKVDKNVFEVKENTDMFKPGISVGLFKNMRIASGWVSVPLKDPGTYDLYIKFNQPVKKGETIRIAVYVNDENGRSIIGKRKDIIWE